MKYASLIRELELKVNEVTDKYNKLRKDVLRADRVPEANDHLEKLIKELELLKQEIEDKYTQVSKEESLNENRLQEIEKVIYDSINSFNTSYNNISSGF